MSKVSINESTLTSIGNAIRAKTGKSELIAPLNMPDEINAIQTGGGEVEPMVLTGDCHSACKGAIPSAYIELYGNTVSTKDVTTATKMFYGYTNKRIPFAINFKADSNYDMSDMFNFSRQLEELPQMNNCYPSTMPNIFMNCNSLKTIPEGFGSDWKWTRMNTYIYTSMTSLFKNCYSLRNIPTSFLKNLWGTTTSAAYSPYYSLATNCYVLDEILGLGVGTGSPSSSAFYETTYCCYRLKNFTFDTNEDGSPKVAKWKSQSLSISKTGYASSTLDMTKYGVPADKEITDDATYQALKNDPDCWTRNIAYSRYNHDSAVNTINTLPDTSAYLATAGGSNTIKFEGAAGSATDGGAINTLTEAEIAVAAARGWTVSFA